MKKLLSTFIGIIIVIFTITYFTGYSLILDFNNESENSNINCLNGTVNPFKDFDFNNDNWKLYVVFKGSDLKELPQNIKRANYLSTTNKKILNNIKISWNFNCTGSDIATVESKLVLLKNGKKVFQSGIVVDNNMQGLQSKKFGWIKSNQIIENLKYFKRSYSPVILP